MNTADKVRKVVAESLRTSDVTDDKSFEEMGADSLDAIEIVMALELELDFTFDDSIDQIDATSTVADLITVVEAQYVQH